MTGTRYGLETCHQCRKWVKKRVRKFCGLIPTFVEVTGEILVEGMVAGEGGSKKYPEYV